MFGYAIGLRNRKRAPFRQFNQTLGRNIPEGQAGEKARLDIFDLAMADFRKHGFMGMVAKPYDISELASVIRGVLAEKSPSRSTSPF